MADVIDIVKLRESIVKKCTSFEENYKKRLSNKELLLSALDLIATVSVKMGKYKSEDSVDEALFEEICSIDEPELMDIGRESYQDGSASILRYVIAQKFINGEIRQKDGPEKLAFEINEIKKNFTENPGYFRKYLQGECDSGLEFIYNYNRRQPFKNWAVPYRCLLPFVYNSDLKKTIWLALEVLRDNLLLDLGIKDTWECKNSQGWYHQARSYFGFEGPSNYGSQRAVLMLHPKEIPDHKNSVQLVCYFYNGNVIYGMDFGINLPKLKYIQKFQKWELLHEEALVDKDYLGKYQTIKQQLAYYLTLAQHENFDIVNKNPEISKKIIAEGNAELSDEDGKNLYLDTASSKGSGGGNNNNINIGGGNKDDDDFNNNEHAFEDFEIKEVGGGESETKVEIKPNIKEFEDYLKRRQLAKHISDEIIKNKKIEPLNIGICGDWGSGKTQFINLIKQYLKDKTFKRTKRINEIHRKHASYTAEAFHWVKKRKVFFFELKEFLSCVFKPLFSLFEITENSFLYKLKNFEFGNIEEDKYKVEIIDFDAWQYDDQEHIWAALIMGIMEKCMGYFWFYTKFMIYKLISYIKNHFKECFLRFVFICLIWLILLNLNAFFNHYETYRNLKDLPLDKQLLFAVLAALIPDLIKVDFINIDKVFVKCFKMPEYKSQLGFRDKIKDLTQFAINYLGKNNKRRIVLFIDNLDRCSSSNIKQVLDSICQFLELCSKKRGNLITIFAMDKQVVSNALKKEGIAEEKLNVYLDKIINLPVNLSMQNDEIESLNSLIKRLFGEEENDIKEMLKNLKDKGALTPRRLANLRYITNILFYMDDKHFTEKDFKSYFE